MKKRNVDELLEIYDDITPEDLGIPTNLENFNWDEKKSEIIKSMKKMATPIFISMLNYLEKNGGVVSSGSSGSSQSTDGWYVITNGDNIIVESSEIDLYIKQFSMVTSKEQASTSDMDNMIFIVSYDVGDYVGGIGNMKFKWPWKAQDKDILINKGEGDWEFTVTTPAEFRPDNQSWAYKDNTVKYTGKFKIASYSKIKLK